MGGPGLSSRVIPDEVISETIDKPNVTGFGTSSSQRIAALALSIVFSSCGNGDEASPRSQSPTEGEAEQTATPQFASAAGSLPAPAPAEPPVLNSAPSAPTDEALRAPPSATTKLALAQGLTSQLLVRPSVLRQTVVGGLKSPTDLGITVDGTFFFTDREQGLFVQRKGGVPVLVFAPRDAVKPASSEVLAVAIDPGFTTNRLVYVFVQSTTATGETETRRVVRVTINESYTQAREVRDILVVNDPSSPKASRGGDPQPGGGLRFGPDGYLYVGLGDGYVPTAPQAAQVLPGKVLRIDRNGQAAPGNHAPAGFDSRVFAYGVRNPVALAFHANTEALLVGQRRGEEIDDIVVATRPGANAGWDPRCAPPRTGYCERSVDQVGGVAASGAATAWRGGKSGEGLSAIERLRGPAWGDWRNAFVVAFERAQRLDLVKFNAEGKVVQAMPALEKLGVGFKAMAQGPDGLYVVTSGKAGGEEIWRLTVQ